MATTVTKGKIFRVTVAIDDGILRAMKMAPELAEKAMSAAAERWHDKILPKHFQKGAHAEYGYAERALTYLKQSFKSGKPDLVYRGTLAHDLKANASYKIGAQASIELKMWARVLNFVPRMPEDSQELKIKHKNGVGYPNLKRELKVLLEDEREAIAKIAVQEIESAFVGLSTSPDLDRAMHETPSLVSLRGVRG